MSRRRPAPKDTPLGATVEKGVLTIRIGVDVLAFAALHSPFAWQMANEQTGTPDEIRPDTLYEIRDPVQFAKDVRSALFDEREDGSSLATDMLDAATQKAIEDGSIAFYDVGEEDEDEDGRTASPGDGGESR